MFFPSRLFCMEAPKVRSAIQWSLENVSTYQTPVDHLGNNYAAGVTQDRLGLSIHVLDAVDWFLGDVKMVPMVIRSLLLMQGSLVLRLCNVFGALHYC